ncbi:hypothetical protein LY76DRAFT_688618, partial [Colletotrichum caudatum]
MVSRPLSSTSILGPSLAADAISNLQTLAFDPDFLSSSMPLCSDTPSTLSPECGACKTLSKDTLTPTSYSKRCSSARR